MKYIKISITTYSFVLTLTQNKMTVLPGGVVTSKSKALLENIISKIFLLKSICLSQDSGFSIPMQLICARMCLDRRQTEENFKIHTYKLWIFAKRGTKQGVYVQSEDCHSIRPANFEKHKFVFWHPKICILYQKSYFLKLISQNAFWTFILRIFHTVSECRKGCRIRQVHVSWLASVR